MKELQLLVGLPGSGKSTFAKELCADKSANFVRVNKDLLREMVHFSEWKPQREEAIMNAEQGIAGLYLIKQNKNVVVDDTNLSPRTVESWVAYAKELEKSFNTKIKVTLKRIDTPVDECVLRDQTRAKKVGNDVIVNMALQYGYMPEEYKYILVDMDGTLADNTDRSNLHLAKTPKDWKSWFKGIPEDKLRTDVWEQVQKLREETGAFIVIVSARAEGACRKLTEEWMTANNIHPLTMIMRGSYDHREDSLVKKDILNKYFPDRSKIIKVFDDRPRVVRMWREEGLDVVDVGDGVDF